MSRAPRRRSWVPLALVALLPGPAGAATTRMPGDFRPVAAEGSARAAWVNPSGIGSSPWQSFLLEMTVVEGEDGKFDAGDPATLSLAASTGRTAYALRWEFEDAEGVPDWAVLVANQVPRRNGTIFGSTVEWRGGEHQSLDGTVALAMRLAGALRGSIVLEDVFASDVDGLDGSRRWRGGLVLRPPGGVFFSWDYDLLESADEGRQWFAGGIDRARKWEVVVAGNDEGDWFVRAGVRLGPARWGGAYGEPDAGPRVAVASIDMLGDPVVR